MAEADVDRLSHWQASLASPVRTGIGRIVRFGLVGVLNTGVGFSVIFAMLWCGFGDIAANIAGYALGLGVSFVANSHWTFADRAAHGTFSRARIAGYGAAFLVAYAANLALIMGARAHGLEQQPLVHLAGMALYTVLFYATVSTSVFADKAPADRPDLLPRSRAALARAWPVLLAFGLLALAWLWLHAMPVTHDVVWQMWIARQLLHGAMLYKDVMEVNPPLWFWMAVPVDRAAHMLGADPVHTMVAAVFLEIGLSLILLWRLVAGYSLWRQAVLLVAAIAALVIVPIPDFAQREHMALIGALPYLVLIARRRDGGEVPVLLALATAAAAAPMFALKHYFVLVPVLLEIWLLAHKRRTWTPLRPEVIVLGLAAVAYAIAVIMLAPRFLTVIVPEVATAYGGYEKPILTVIAKPCVLIWLIAAVASLRQRHVCSSLTIASLISMLAFALSYLLQQKGWFYQAVPAIGMAVFAVATTRFRRETWRRDRATFAVLCLIGFGAVFQSLKAGPYHNVRAPYVRHLLAGTAPGSTVAMLTANPSNIWPMIDRMGFVWPSRVFTFWMLYSINAIQHDAARRKALDALADTVRAQTVDDLSCNVPAVIVVDDFSASYSPGFDVLSFFEKNAQFRMLFSHYVKGLKRGPYTAYHKVSGWAPSRPADCRTIY